MRFNRMLLLAGFASLATANPANAQENFVQAVQDSSTQVNFRLRYEDVSWDGLEDASAFTLRSRLSYASGDYRKLRLTAEFDDVREIDTLDYRTAPNDPQNPGTVLIADPEGTDLNQAYLSYSTTRYQIRYGRQRILLDNQRFVGGVGWRQNEQTYDALNITTRTIYNTEVNYAYITQVNRIFGKNNPQGNHHHTSHVFNARYTGSPASKLVGYAYVIDNKSAPGLSSNTYGLSWDTKVNDTLSYRLEYAVQSDAGDNPVNYSTDYLLGESRLTLGKVTATLGYEALGSDSGVQGFTTSLATLHAFQGWTDRFLDTPNTGIRDTYLGIAGTTAGINLTANFHDLRSDVGTIHYGREWGLSASKKFGPVVYTGKYADYRREAFGSNTRKFWLMAELAW